MKKQADNEMLWRQRIYFDIPLSFYHLPDYSFPRHFHDHAVIEFVVQGFDNFNCKGKMFRASPGEVVLINSGEVHTGSSSTHAPLRYFSLCPEPAQWQAVMECLETNNRNQEFTRAVFDSKRLNYLFHRFVDCWEKHGYSLLSEESFLLLARELATVQQVLPDRPKVFAVESDAIQKAEDWIRQHFREPLQLTRLASYVHLHPTYLIRAFRKNRGLTPGEFQLSLRIDKARHLLEKGFPVQQAALAAGFHDAAHFNRLFRKIAVTSPTAYLSSKSQYRTKSE